jgi:hypothetical protein
MLFPLPPFSAISGGGMEELKGYPGRPGGANSCKGAEQAERPPFTHRADRRFRGKPRPVPPPKYWRGRGA